MNARPLATLEPVRFGEFLLLRHKISDEQWLAALAAHWSAAERRLVGASIVDNGFMTQEQVDAEARVFHDEIEIVEVVPRSEAVTVPPPYRS